MNYEIAFTADRSSKQDRENPYEALTTQCVCPFELAGGSQTAIPRPHSHRPRTLHIISELVGQSFRKNSNWLILGNVLFDFELVGSGPRATTSETIKWITPPQHRTIFSPALALPASSPSIICR